MAALEPVAADYVAAVRAKRIVSDTCIETEVVLIASCQIWVMALMARD